jgi:nucleoside-diphosphate-sugar epimerase
MRLAILGGIGGHLLRWALDAGHQVTALTEDGWIGAAPALAY